MAKIDRRLVYDKFKGKCSYCGHDLNGKFQVDHLVSRFSHDYKKLVTDPDDFENLMPACASCNNYKSTYGIEEFRKQLGLLVERLNKRMVIYRIAKRFGQIEENNTPIEFHFEKVTKGDIGG